MIQKAKRTLAMLMAAVMLCGLLPVSAMATTTEQDPVDATTTPVMTEQPEATEQPAATETPAPSETVLPTEQPEETLPDEDTPTAGLPEEVMELYALTYEGLLASTMEKDQPFASGTLGSQNFRIPALVTLSDGAGTLVAAADARWDGTYDGKNVDTMVAVSKDNGQSWTTSLVNYFADTEDKQTSGAASFIDPALATDGENVYLLVDVFPGGVNLLSETCQAGTGYNENGLMLKKSGESGYSYYVGEFTDGYAPVMSSAGETEYAVDERYDLYTVRDGKYTAVSYRETGDNGAYIAANVFYRDATFTVYPTSYLWLVKSEDGGETWSAPQILNDDVKGDSETFYGVGPGRGLVTSDGTIYFSCYYHDGSELGASSQRSSLIYSKDDGATWKRTENLQSSGSNSSKWSSENQVVQLDDGTIRMFYRNGRGFLCYADLKGDGWSAPTALDPDGDHICSNCQLSVIHYSKKINGKESIVVSCPAQYEKGDWGSATSGSRENGKIFVFTLDENNTMSVAYTYELTAADEYFAYSCLTELENGDIGILYENGAASITYEKISLNAILGQDESGEFPQITEDGSILAETELSMKQDDAAKTLNVALEEGQILSATSSNDAVLKVEVGENGTFTLTPVGEGTAVVTLTITSAAGVQSRNASADLTKTLQIDVTAPAVATYGFIGTGTANTGDGKPVTKLTTNVKQEYTVRLDQPLTSGQYVEWKSNDSNVATVDNSGKITATGQGTANITATVKNSDGTTAGTATMPVAVIRGEPGGISHWDFSFYIDEIIHTSVYYSADASSTMVPVQEGEVFYIKIRFTDKYAFAFFGAPEEGYALTDMRAPGTEGQYYPLHKNGVIEKNDTDYFFKGDIGKNFRNLYDTEWFEEKYTYTLDMVNAAIKKDCDGGMGFTKGTAAIKNPSSSLTFRSEKLPTLTKAVVSVNGVPYKEGMVAHVGDEVVFRITVTKYASQTGITYTDAIVTDNALPGVNLNENITEYLKGNGANTWTCDVKYTIQKEDLNQSIKNTADLTYHYRSQYSTGAMSSSATAEASITAAKFNPGSYVVDFGLPVTFNFTGVEKPGDFVKGYSATEVADVVVQGDKVTYTLNKAMIGPDTVILEDEYGGINSFTIYPATTVYYDASFVEGLTEKSTSGLKYQTATAVGAETLNYGYQKDYSNSASGTLTSEATFTFTGTGVDIYANPTSTSCYVAVRIYKDKELVRLYVVDTAMEAGTTTYTTVPTSQSYNVPIVSELGLEYGTYTVKIQRVDPEKANVSGRNKVVLNGFRVYGTLADGDTTYTKDGEASPTFTQLRDVLINTLWSNFKINKPSANLDQQYDQVYAEPATSGMTASIGSDLTANDLTANDAQDLLINGPKNEIYLTGNQTLTITVPDEGNYQIGLKALDAASGTVKINDTEKNVTNVDMFYEVTVDGNKKITIKNTSGSAMIAVTYLKKTVR